MKVQVTLLLISMLCSEAMSMTCNKCGPTSEKCEEKECGDQCVSARTVVYAKNIKVANITIKDCGLPELCGKTSLNLGFIKVTSNAKCCKTRLCNNETMPALPRQPTNSKMCFSCDLLGCKKELKCEGTEDHCFTAAVNEMGLEKTMKGCASKSLCEKINSFNIPYVKIKNVKCCEGNLCNGAERFTLSFLLMIIPLILSIHFQ